MRQLPLALILSSAALFAAEETLPKAETILDRYVEVTGGKAAYESRRNEVAHGSLELAGKGIKGSITMYLAEPNLSLAIIDLEGVGKIESGSDGSLAWEKSAIQGARIKQGDERIDALRDTAFNAPLRWRELYDHAQTVGGETVNGQDTYKVVLTPKTGRPITHFYDKKTGLLIKSAAVRNTPMGEIAAEILLSDYRPEGGVLVPHLLANKVAGQEFHIQIEKTESNVDMPRDRFQPPADIKALLNKAPQDQPPPAPAAAPAAPPAEANTGDFVGKLSIYSGDKPLASETYTIRKTAGKIEIDGSGAATLGTLKVEIERFHVTSDDRYQPISADAKAKMGTISMKVVTTFAGGKAVNQIDNGQSVKTKEDSVHAGAVVVNANLPLYPWSILAMRAATKDQAPQEFFMYVLGQGEVPATVVFKGREKVEFEGKTAQLDHITASGKTPQGQPIALDFWVDDDRRLIKMAVPSQNVEAYQEGYRRLPAPAPAPKPAPDAPAAPPPH